MNHADEISVEELEAAGAILEIQDGNHGDKHPKSTDYVESGIPFIMASDIYDGRVDLTNCKFLIKSQADDLRIGFAKTGDVLLTHKGSIGNTAIVPPISDYIMLTPQVTYYRLNPALIDNRYLVYAFSEPGFQSRLALFSAQSTRPYIGITAQRKMKIFFHPLTKQRKIVSILSAYDDLIANNTRRIEILEEMARSLYREWFVNFRFPGYEKVRMVKSELGQIPEGWKVERLETVAEEFIDYRGKTPKKLGGEWSDSGIRALSALNVKQGRLINLDKAKFVTEELYKRWMKIELEAGDILMTSEAPLGEVYFLPEKRRYCLSQRVFSIRSNKARMQPSLLFFALSSPEGQEELKSRASGTTVLGIRQADLRRIPVIRPPEALQQHGDLILRPVLMMIDLLQRKSHNLSRTRDYLLPKLISGEIDVTRFAKEDVGVTT